MTVQAFLTIWIIVQTLIKIGKQPAEAHMREWSEAQLIGAVVGSAVWGVGMLFCLWAGGFYD